MNESRHDEVELVRARVKKRKSDECTNAASALLSLVDTKVKKHRPTTPNAETRDLPTSSPSLSSEIRETDESRDNDHATPPSSSKLSRRFMSRFEHSNTPVTPATPASAPNKIVDSVDSSELASAMALASLAFRSSSSPSNSSRYHMKSPIANHHPPRRVPYRQDMQTFTPRMPNFPPHNPYAHMSLDYQRHQYHNGIPYGYQYHQPTYVRTPPSSNKWACDYCTHSFTSYKEACGHEKACVYNPMNQSKTKSGLSPLMKKTQQPKSIAMTENITSPDDDDESKYFCGVIPLAVPDADHEWLSEMNCYIRSQCIEVFSADEDDVTKSSKRGRISLKQVGIRCKLCAHEDIDDRAMSAVSYPVSSSGIYESVKRWVKIHLRLCKCIPNDVKEKIEELEKAAFVPTTRQYWVDSAKALGIEDTISGLRFTHDITDPNNAKKAAETLLSSRSGKTTSNASGTAADKADSRPADSKYIVFPSDETIITPFLYALLRQVEPCQFTDADRYIARSRCQIGFNGFQCRHCSGHAGLGKYFPTSTKALSTNSTSQNIFSHVLKCRKCPEEVKEKLKALKYDKGHWTRRTTGWRQKFFEQVWRRLHGDEASKTGT